jgi:hypothetical protein
MRKAILALAAGITFVFTAPQASSAAPGSGLAGVQTGTSLAEHATYYRRDYDYYYPRYRYYGYGDYPRYRHYRYYDHGYYPRHHYYRYDHYRPYRNYYYRRYWY